MCDTGILRIGEKKRAAVLALFDPVSSCGGYLLFRIK